MSSQCHLNHLRPYYQYLGNQAFYARSIDYNHVGYLSKKCLTAPTRPAAFPSDAATICFGKK